MHIKQSSIGHFRVQKNSHFQDEANPSLKKKKFSVCMGIKKQTVSYQWLCTLPHFEIEAWAIRKFS